MKMLLLTVIALLATIPAMAADISGRWQAEFDTQIGVQKYLFTFRVEGDKVTGTAEAEVMGEKHKTELKDIKLVGDDLSFTETLDFQGNALTISYKGKVSGNEIKFTRQVGEFATEELVAKRIQEGAAAPAAAPAAAGRGRMGGPPIMLGPEDKATFPAACPLPKLSPRRNH